MVPTPGIETHPLWGCERSKSLTTGPPGNIGGFKKKLLMFGSTGSFLYANAGDMRHRFNPWVREILWRRAIFPTQ